MRKNKLSPISKVLAIQILLITITTIGFVIVDGWIAARSAFLGGFAAFIPNVYFAIRVAKSAGQEAKKVVKSFYTGESGKLILTVILFGLIFQLPNIEIKALFTGYIVALTVFWFALLIRDY